MTSLLLLVLLGCASNTFATISSWDGLRVRWDLTAVADPFHLWSLFGMPKTLDDATSDGWVSAGEADVNAYCLEDDPRVCLLYDANGIIAGIDVSVLTSDVDDLGVDYDWESQDLFVTTTRFGYEVYRTRVWFVSEDEVNNGRDTYEDGIGSGLWFEGKSGRVEIPTNLTEIVEQTLFTQQNCIITMGTHYYNNMTEEADCSQFQPYFLLVNEDTGLVHGVGFQTYGVSSTTSRNWFESIPSAAIKPTVPYSPDCLTEWVADYGVISLHIYFVDSPLSITC